MKFLKCHYCANKDICTVFKDMKDVEDWYRSKKTVFECANKNAKMPLTLSSNCSLYVDEDKVGKP